MNIEGHYRVHYMTIDDSRTTRMTKEMMMTVWCLKCEFGIREIRKLATLINLVVVKKFC